MNIKIEQTDLRLIQKIASKRGEGYADFVRVVLRKELARMGFLDLESSKALEIFSN